MFFSTNLRKDSLAFCLPLSIRLSFSSSLSFFFVFFRISSFIALYLFNSSIINLNSSSLTKSSVNALDTCEAIISNFELANVFIFKCFSPLIVVFLTTILPINENAPATIPPIPNPNATGEPTQLDIKTAAATSVQTVAPIKTLSTIPTYLAARKYFLENASRLELSSSKKFITSVITFNLCE